MYGVNIGEYNVDLYEDPVLDHKTGAEYYVTIITKFDYNDKEIGHKRFYILKEDYKKIGNLIMNKATLEKMYACPENKRFQYVEVNVTKAIKEGVLI